MVNFNNKLALSFFVYFGFILIGVWVLNFHDPVIDLEALEMGNHAVGLIDGIVEGFDFSITDISKREGWIYFISHLAVLFYSFFGANLYYLNLLGVFLFGFWALVWFLVACEIFKKRRFLLAILFIFGTPLIHLRPSVMIVFTSHGGSSLIFGLSLLFLLKAVKLDYGLRKKMFLFVSGILYTASVFYGMISALLLPLIAIIFLKSSLELRDIKFWLLGLLPALFIWDWGFFQRTVHDTNYSLFLTLETFFLILVHFGGFLSGEIEISRISLSYFAYSIWSAYYIFILIGLSLFFLYNKLIKGKQKISCFLDSLSMEFYSFFIGSLIFVGAVSFFRDGVSFDVFDGIRYLIPIVPFYLIGIGFFLVEFWDYKLVKVVFSTYLLMTCFAIFSFTYPLNSEPNKNFYKNIPGYDLGYLVHSPDAVTRMDVTGIKDKRLNKYLFYMGFAYLDVGFDSAQKKDVKINLRDSLEGREAELVDKGLNEFTRGYYFNKGLQSERCQVNNSSEESLQGFGMAIIFNKRFVDDCFPGDREKIFNLGWGYGRAKTHDKITGYEFYDFTKGQGVEEVKDRGEEFHKGFEEGSNWVSENFGKLDVFFPWTVYFIYK